MYVQEIILTFEQRMNAGITNRSSESGNQVKADGGQDSTLGLYTLEGSSSPK